MEQSRHLHADDFFIDGVYDLDILQEHFLHGGVLDFTSLIELIYNAIQYLNDEPNVVEVEQESFVFGDVHGNYFNLVNMLNDDMFSTTPHVKIFLGDYVDRGKWSTEALITLLCMKCNEPDKVVLLRGNHESRSMTKKFGFETECLWKYNHEIYESFIELFDYLPLAATLTLKLGTFFLCHGGISPSLQYISHINRIKRVRDIPTDGLFCDLLWADPIRYETYEYLYDTREIDSDWYELTYIPNTDRGCSYFYGYEAVLQFLESNEIKAIVRAHECVDGIEQLDFESEDGVPLVYTVFSSSGYDCDNRGGILFMGHKELKADLYTNVDVTLKQPILADAFQLSAPSLVEELTKAIDQLFIYGFFFCDDDDEEDENFIQQIEKYDDDNSGTEEGTPRTLAPTFAMPTVSTSNKIYFASPKNDVCFSLPSTTFFDANSSQGNSTQDKQLFLSLSTSQKKKDSFKSKLSRWNEYFPLTIEELRENWTKTIDNTSQSSSCQSLGSSSDQIKSKHILLPSDCYNSGFDMSSEYATPKKGF
ncbi:Serine/threonine-protein phosphatase [Entamoeba marina]